MTGGVAGVRAPDEGSAPPPEAGGAFAALGRRPELLAALPRLG